MSIEAALQRVSELRSRLGIDTGSSATAASAGNASAFTAALDQAQARDLLAGAADPGTGANPLAMTESGIPILSVADQYRMLGIEPPTAADPRGSYGLLGIGGTSPIGVPTGGNVGARMVELARRELGVTEDPPGSNEGSRIREFRTATAGAEGTPGPWCAYFVSWLAQQSGAPIGAGGNGTGYVPTLEAWGKQEGRFTAFGDGRPQPGDIVIFDWGGDGTADHTGIVERVDADGTIHTIEGNSSDSVKRRDYAASTNDIRGYVRPG